MPIDLLFRGFVALMLGSLAFGCWIGLLRGVDVRKLGSGGTGATNVWRALGPLLGSVVFVLDAGKGAVAAHLGQEYGPLVVTIFGLLAMIGHSKSVFLDFKGSGKAVACLLGVALILNWQIAVLALVFWLLVLIQRRFVSLASIDAAFFFAWALTAGSNLPVLVKLVFWAAAIFVWVKHFANLARIKKGEEPRVSMPWDKWGKIVNTTTRVGFLVDAGEHGEDADYYRKMLSRNGKWKLRALGFVLRHIPDSWVHRIRHSLSHIKMGSISSTVNNQTVEIVYEGIPKSARELEADKTGACQSFLKAISSLAKKGIELVGLGGFTAVVSDQGNDIVWDANRKSHCSVTTGNTLTALSAIAVLLILAWLAGKKLSGCVLVVVGGGGSIGLVCARLLACLVSQVILAGHTTPLDAAVHEIGSANVSWTFDLESALGQADLIIIAASNNEGIEIDPACMKSGAVGVSLSRPRFIIEGREDVLIVAGGIYELPGQIEQSFHFGLGDREVFACMGEVFTLAKAGMLNGNFSRGKVLDPDSVLLIGRLARKHGLTLARFRSTTDEPIPPSRLGKYLLATGHEDPAYPGTLERETWLRLTLLPSKMAEFDLEAALTETA